MSQFVFNGALKGLTCLVVDDEPDNVGVITRLLALMGARVAIAEHGLEGLELARKDAPHVVFADLSMPVMTGWQMIYEMRQDALLKNIPVVALTAHAMTGDRERVMGAGFAGYIAKPIDVPVFMPNLVAMLKDLPQLASHFSESVKETHER
jgi:two-component system, cell cycle response regulator DivK